MSRLLRLGALVLAMAALPAAARAEWQLKPFGGITFGGDTTFLNLDGAAGTPKFNLGVSTRWQGNIFGLEGDVGTTSGFFSGTGKDRLVLRSHVATFTGNVMAALPRHVAGYGLRPYAVGGLGVMHVGWYDNLAGLAYANTMSVLDVGGGATGFLSDLIGVNWDVRFFRTLRSEKAVSGVSFGPEQLSFWRATMGFAFRL